MLMLQMDRRPHPMQPFATSATTVMLGLPTPGIFQECAITPRFEAHVVAGTKGIPGICVSWHWHAACSGEATAAALAAACVTVMLGLTPSNPWNISAKRDLPKLKSPCCRWYIGDSRHMCVMALACCLILFALCEAAAACI